MGELQNKLDRLRSMELHEVGCVAQSDKVHLNYVIIKVRGGWIYTVTNLVSGKMNSVFVPDRLNVNFDSLNETLENHGT